MLAPRSSGEFIANNSEHVFIISEGIKSVSNKIYDLVANDPERLSVDRWKLSILLPQSRDTFAINWIFLSDVLNYSFWCPEKQKYMVRYKEREWTGFWSLCAAMWRAIDDGVDITNPLFYSKITKEQLEKIFRSDSDFQMPLLEQRLHSMHKEGTVLLEKYGGDFKNVLKTCNGSAIKLLHIIVGAFETFSDEVRYKDQDCAIYKRAQILVGDLWACMGGTGLCNFYDIDQITAFADYRVPQALVWLGALNYSPQLMALLQKDHNFESGDQMEVEIRGCTIWAIEQIVEELKKLFSMDRKERNEVKINSIIIDNFLWDLRKEMEKETLEIPYHKIRCIYY